MVSVFDGYNYVIRLDKGERLSSALERFFAEADIEGGWVSGLGGALEVELGFYNLETQQYQWKTITQTLEITALQGNVALNDQQKLVWHLHGTFAGEDYQAVGGHVKDLIVGGTCELFVHRTFKPLHRKHDDVVGLNTLDV